MNDAMSHYDTLGVSGDASAEDIKLAHRRLARRYHPDVSREPNAHEKFQEVQHAFDVVGDPERRAHYDKTGKDNIPDHMEEARGMLAYVMKKVLIATIDAPHVNLVSAIHLHLSKMQDEMNKQMQELEEQLPKMEKHLGRVKTRGNTLNMYEAIVQAEIEEAKKAIKNYPVMIERVRNARKIMKEYECEEKTEGDWRTIFLGSR